MQIYKTTYGPRGCIDNLLAHGHGFPNILRILPCLPSSTTSAGEAAWPQLVFVCNTCNTLAAGLWLFIPVKWTPDIHVSCTHEAAAAGKYYTTEIPKGTKVCEKLSKHSHLPSLSRNIFAEKVHRQKQVHFGMEEKVW